MLEEDKKWVPVIADKEISKAFNSCFQIYEEVSRIEWGLGAWTVDLFIRDMSQWEIEIIHYGGLETKRQEGGKILFGIDLEVKAYLSHDMRIIVACIGKTSLMEKINRMTNYQWAKKILFS